MCRKMKYIGVFLVVLALLVIPVAALDGQSTTPNQATSYLFKQAVNYTPSTTAVIAVANSNDYNIIALAGLVARHEHAPMFITPRDQLSPEVIEALQQLMTNANFNKVIVVGVGHNASNIADLISKVTVPEKPLVTRIIATDVYNLSLKVAIYEWSSVSKAVVCDGNVPEDLAEGVMIAYTDNIPLLYEQAPLASINATLKLLGVNTVYTTPADEATTDSYLQNAGYTVNGSWNGLDLSAHLDVLVDQSQPVRNATIVVGSYKDFIRCANVMGLNASILVTNSTDVLGTYADNYLKTTKPAFVLVIGNNTRVGDQVVIDIAAATTKHVERLFFSNDYQMINRLGLLEAEYIYPVIVVEKVTTNGIHYKYLFRNIGFSDAVRYGDYAVKIEFTKCAGEFKNTTIPITFQNSTKVIFYYTKNVVPYDTFTLEFDVTPGTNFSSYPAITYNAVTLAGAIISVKSYVSQLLTKVQQLKDWFVSMFQKFFGIIKVHIPLPGVAQTISAAIVVFFIFWTIIGGIVYVIKAFVLKRRITSPAYYGLVGWILGKRG